MASINSAFSIITGALDADQSALSIVANNVANANTEGYTKETPTFLEREAIRINGVNYGSGVEQAGAASVRDRVLEERLVQQQQLASGSDARLTALDTLQALFTPSSGSSSSTAGDISGDLTSFFQSLSSLEANPTDNTLRQAVLSSANTLAGDISNTASSLNSQRSELDQQVGSITSQVNVLLGNIASLNEQIKTTSPTGDAGVLEDQRQQAISQLSKLIGFNEVTTEDNGITLQTTSGQLLVSGGSSFQLTCGQVNGVTHLYVGTIDATDTLAQSGGQMGGYLTARDQDIPDVQQELDQLAYSVSTQVNTVNNAGANLNGQSGNAGDIFSQPTQVAGAAAQMSVTMTDPNAIAAAGAGKGTGDNSNAVALAALSDQSLVAGFSPVNYYSNMVSRLGSSVSEVEAQNTAQAASVSQLQSQVNSLSAVNLNDEAAAMQQYERSYEAASKVYTILDSLMASAINLGVQTTVS